MLSRWRISTGLYNWSAVLPDIIYNYNRNLHRTIKSRPVDIFNNVDINHQLIHFVDNEFVIGDRCRKKKDHQSDTFVKDDSRKYSNTIYTVSNIEGNKLYITNPAGVQLQKFYKTYELLKVDDVEDMSSDDEDDNNKINQMEIHKETQKTKKIDKALNKAGVEEKNVIAEKVPRIKKISSKYKDYT